jgi:hypothetical protein
VPRWALTLGAAAAVALVAATLLALSRPAASLPSEPSLQLSALGAANQELSAKVAALPATGPGDQLLPVLDRARRAMAETRAQVGPAARHDRWLADGVRAALAAQQTLVDQVATAASDPLAARPAIAQRAAQQVTTLYAVNEALAAVPAPRTASLVAWVQARHAAPDRLTTAALMGAIDPILARARRGRLLLGQIHSGGDGRMRDVVANRRAVLAAAERLPIGRGTLATTRTLLVRAFEATLAADIAIQERRSPDEASRRATTAKAAFLEAYNTLRARRGLALLGDDF